MTSSPLTVDVCAAHGCYKPPLPGMGAIKACLEHAIEVWGSVQAHKKQTAARSGPGFVYYLRLDEKIKIGWTGNLEQRLMAYPPHIVFLAGHPGTRADERDLHRSFRPFLAAGREWYHPAQLLLDHIATVKAEMDAREADRKKVPNPFSAAYSPAA